MTTIEAKLLASGDEVGKGYKGYLLGIVMRATPTLVSIYWQDQKPHETTTYSKADVELRDIVLQRKALLKSVGHHKNGATNGDTPCPTRAAPVR